MFFISKKDAESLAGNHHLPEGIQTEGRRGVLPMLSPCPDKARMHKAFVNKAFGTGFLQIKTGGTG
jgi:hypothetical protein